MGVSAAETADGAVPGIRGRHLPSADASRAEPFEVFYASHVDRVYRALAVALGDPDLAREATDEAMLRAYARWTSVGAYENPGGWVFRVGMNWATSWWRRVRRERPMSDHRADPPVEPPDAAAIAAVAAVAALPFPMRAVVVCRVLLELSTSETATALGVAEGTVKSRLARALAGLRTTLTEEGR